MIAIQKGLFNPKQLLGKHWENLKSVTLAAPVLTWGSPALTKAAAQLIYRNLERVESKRGWFDCGQLWK